MTAEWIQFWITALMLAAALFSFAAAVFGIYRFGFVMNRMHAAGIGDTFGILFMAAGLAVSAGFSMETLKMLLVPAFLWFTSPVSTHFLAQVEYYTNPELYKYMGRRDFGGTPVPGEDNGED